VDYLTVNHITKELYWAETGGYIEGGFIGWEVIPERSHHEDLQKYLALGYSYTKFPYKLDFLTALAILTSIGLFWYLIHKSKAKKDFKT